MCAMPEYAPQVPNPVRRRTRRSQYGASRAQYYRTIGLAVAVCTGLTASIGGFTRVTVAGYEVNHLQARLDHLQQVNRSLQSQVALLEQPGRVIAQAQASGFAPVDPGLTEHVGTGASRPTVTLAQATY